MAVECQCKNGLHVQEDHFIIEVIDPDTGEPVPEGEEGEIVFTSLMKEGLPIIRYRTRDIASIITEPCPCGRTSVRMSRVSGRTDDMLIIRGVNVFPSQVESILLDIGQTEPHYLLVVDRVNNLDVLTVKVEVSEALFAFDEVRKLEQLGKDISAALQSGLGISVKVQLVEPKTLERSEGKAKRVVDNRKF